MLGESLRTRGICGNSKVPGRIWNPPLRCRGRCSSSTRRCPTSHGFCGRAIKPGKHHSASQSAASSSACSSVRRSKPRACVICWNTAHRALAGLGVVGRVCGFSQRSASRKNCLASLRRLGLNTAVSYPLPNHGRDVKRHGHLQQVVVFHRKNCGSSQRCGSIC